MSGTWRVYGYKGARIGPGHSTLNAAKSALERRVDWKVQGTYGGNPGVWSYFVHGHRYWILEDSSAGFPRGSGLEHLNPRPRCCNLVHAGDECPW